MCSRTPHVGKQCWRLKQVHHQRIRSTITGKNQFQKQKMLRCRTYKMIDRRAHITMHMKSLFFPPENLNSPIPSNASVSEVTIEEVEDIDAPGQSSGEGEMSEEGVGFEFIEDYPAEAGTPGPGRRKKMPFEKLKRAQREENQEPWSPFANEEEWELARWLMTAGVSQARVDEFLKLSIVSAIVQTQPSLLMQFSKDTKAYQAIVSQQTSTLGKNRCSA
jgi:hypothetical protein